MATMETESHHHRRDSRAAGLPRRPPADRPRPVWREFLAAEGVSPLDQRHRGGRRKARRGRGTALLQVVCSPPTGRQRGVHRPYPGEVGHGSVLEHAVFNLIVTGVSRSFTHELVRHRVRIWISASLANALLMNQNASSSSRTRSPTTPELHQIWLEAISSCQEAPTKSSPTAWSPSSRTSRTSTLAPQKSSRGRPLGPAQRHRNPNLRHRQRPRPPPLHRDAWRRRRRRRDSQGRSRPCSASSRTKARICSAITPS